MAIHDFLSRAYERVRIRLYDGSVHTGRFRTEILSASALSVYFYGDARDISLPIADIETIESLEDLQLAS